MATMTRLTSIEQLNDALGASHDRPLFLFKHSTRCPISAAAYQQVTSYLEDEPNESIDYRMIYVVEDRPVSLEAAELIGIQHASPQVILVSGGNPIWNTSHSYITSHALKDELL
ncbi:bacillithiol system redox-active protein YtxJ [Paenibacillus macquariensis]|uniref:Bacillithiol system protein YtxJ n=1 Tax=Paenibacillus macquariensis TaxID=948756 RepID=A0ABY1JL74_9BACL|nr:bacillithiol system redox-active protein YtxJ [Paenibacillus macquariensis]MEC0090088.1 bacillithiol system redox-active protein YtxJ [Paenibacillus macquariensis]OAB31033.1 general stress protein [Paenibacillus macquariensis subsp. macquariensis]SIQ37463.1 bacillithiol system protein YtxJ [Paenibacillus macquariensis]